MCFFSRIIFGHTVSDTEVAEKTKHSTSIKLAGAFNLLLNTMCFSNLYI
ncbi:hypothetical protein BN134_240 [Cronobacter dublinensis 1210]|uniref:Uncharacterized protein n=1 Tax=Cronobacter dublinensis 1210 TaxID=1208656 RepID=A0ABP1W3T0_9ENTR|nr:hypothetical protein BN134_240 [Cronobacter dublinensis 1210]